MTMEKISQQVLHSKLDDILDQVSEKQITTLVTKDDQPVAVIFPYEIYQQWTMAREHRLRRAYQELKTWTSEHSEILTGLNSVQLVRETRDSR